MSDKTKMAIADSIEFANERAGADVKDRAVKFTCYLAGYIRKDHPDLADALCDLMAIESRAHHAIAQPRAEATC